jgi:farnesyl diphosphate synthase
MNNLEKFAQQIEGWLAAVESSQPLFIGLKESSTYALCQGGKRFRPVLCLAVGEVLGVPAEGLRSYAVAVEMIHAASLVHDDLPGLDNSDERRGRPAVHIEFGEAAGILAGDLLISEAFRTISQAKEISAEVRCKWIAELAVANGLICSGQLREIISKRGGSMQSDLVIQEKTAALIRAAVLGAPILLGDRLEPEKWAFWSDFGIRLGTLFQLRDDQLDNEAGVQHQNKGEILFSELSKIVDENYPAAGQNLIGLVEFVWGRES